MQEQERTEECQDERHPQGCAMEESLPPELLSHILGMLPKGMVAIAALTCKRWFSCSPSPLRLLLDVETVCGEATLLRWALENGCPSRTFLYEAAAKQGQLQIMKWLKEEHGCPYKWARTSQVCSHAARSGNLEMLQWAMDNGFYWEASTFDEAAAEGHLSLLQWVRARGHLWSLWAYGRAAQNGHVDVLKYMLEELPGVLTHLPADSALKPQFWAAKAGNMEVLRFLRATTRCEWDRLTCSGAAKGATCRCCNGCESKAAHGMGRPAQRQQATDI
ncbi:Ankyrin repeat-containing domain [Balamuthia mandrillaris]